MINTLTSVQTLDNAINVHEKFSTAGDALAYGLPMSLFGFAMVFFVLMLLWGILSLLKVFFYTIPNSRENPKKKEVKEPVKKAEPVVQPTSEVVADNSNEIVAAIIAAIEAYRASAGHSTPGGFKVVSFKKRI